MARDGESEFGRRDFFRRLWPLSARGDEAPQLRQDGVALPRGPVPPCLRLTHRLENPCVGCDAPCVGVCEPRVIRIHEPQDDFAGRAYLDFERAGCTWCGDCREVCPATEPDRKPARIGVALLSQDACLPWQNVVCIACQSVCPRSALLFDERGRPTVHPIQCDGCGMCVAPCPTDAFRVVPENPRP